MGAQGAAVERLPGWARAVLGVMAAGAVVAVGAAVLRPDGPWCDDEGDSLCPAEVRHDGRMYVVECLDPGPVARRDAELRVRYHGGGEETERRAWTVDGVPAEDLILLDQAGSDCDGTEAAYGEDLSATDAQALLHPAG